MTESWAWVAVAGAWTLGTALYGILLGLFFSGVDRVLVARMQSRIGPPLLQPFADVRKLMIKQDAVPGGATGGVFRWAPVLARAGGLTALVYIPLGGLGGGSPLPGGGDAVLALYLLMLPGLAMVVGGFASGSPYASVGAQREMVAMVSYELPLAMTVMTFAWRLAEAGVAEPFSLQTMAAHPIWAEAGPFGWVGAAILLGTMLLVLPGELGRIPFDAAEAETELAGGILVEYSGRSLALFELALAVKNVALCGLMCALFWPWRAGSLAGGGAGWGAVLDLLGFAVKSGVFLFAGVSLVRAGMARFRVTDIVRFYWKHLGLASLVGMALLALDAWL